MSRYARYKDLKIEVAEKKRHRQPEPSGGAQRHQLAADSRAAHDLAWALESWRDGAGSRQVC
jgi:hypothetical protein